jgi:MFS family permease
VIVATLCVTETITWGIVYYGFPVFLASMEADLGASRVVITGAFSLGLGISALSAITVGRWLDRHGPRLLMTLGSVAATLLMLAWAHVRDVSVLYAVWALMGFAMAATLYEPAFAAVVQWFTTHRDRALLTLTLAAGLASTIFMPLEAWLIARLGWRSALEVLAVVLGVTTVPLHACLLRAPARTPAASAVARTHETASSMSLAGARRTLVFWVLAVAFLLGNFATASVTVHLIPHLVAHGYTPAIAAAAIGWIGAMQLLGRLVFAPIAARFGSRPTTATAFFAQAAGLVQVTTLSWLPTILPAIVLLGAANGSLTLARATIVSDVFGRRHYGAISGAIALAANGARALGPVGASVLFLALGTYERVFLALAAPLVVAGLAVLLASGQSDSRT